MIRLGKKELKTQNDEFTKLGIKTPDYDFETIWDTTKRSPVWLHFGGGNLFRAYHSVLQQHLIELNEADKGIIVVSTSSGELVEKIYHPHDNLSLHVIMKAEGSLDMEVIASVAESISTNTGPDSWERLKDLFRQPSLQLITFTITEKGYDLRDLRGEIRTTVKEEIEQGPGNPKHTMVMVAALLYERYQTDKAPLALVSTDNFSHNGDKLKEAILTVANVWEEVGFVERGFIDYLNDETKITFPWSMIDKITPLPSKEVSNRLSAIGYGCAELLYTKPKGPPMASFVNSEETGYLVIEDRFPNGRPALEKVGVYFTERQVVDQVERMKVCTCLNPLHTALAIFGCLLDYQSIAQTMKDEDLKAFVEKIGYEEGMKTVTDPGIISPMGFIKEVIEVRLPNPHIPDSPQRIATDTSQKLAIRFGETVKAYLERVDLDVNDLTYIPLTIAGWFRYLLGKNDEGEPMEISPDPLLDELQAYLVEVKVGHPDSLNYQLTSILSNERIFGVNLVEIGLAKKIEEGFRELISGPGAVRSTLHKYVRGLKD